MKRDAIYWAERAERGIYWTVGTILVLSAAVFLVYTIREAFLAYTEGHFTSATIRAFDRSLLTLMLAQIVYTTLSYLRQGMLQVEPVLVVGIIAVVRRILVLTAVVSGTSGEMGLVITFEQSMTELGLLALTVLVLAVAVYLVRKGKDKAT
jgi:uncharacterized membrane protein (DUF373 family)